MGVTTGVLFHFETAAAVQESGLFSTPTWVRVVKDLVLSHR
jgi:hypothetical protein